VIIAVTLLRPQPASSRALLPASRPLLLTELRTAPRQRVHASRRLAPRSLPGELLSARSEGPLYEHGLSWPRGPPALISGQLVSAALMSAGSRFSHPVLGEQYSLEGHPNIADASVSPGAAAGCGRAVGALNA
jgi:hypothetical protein